MQAADKLLSGTSNRRRIFMTWNEAGQKAGLPKSVFCKGSADLINRLVLSSWGTLTEVSLLCLYMSPTCD